MADGHRRLSQAFLQIMLDRRYLPLADVRLVIDSLNHKYDYDMNFGDDIELLDFISEYSGEVRLEPWRALAFAFSSVPIRSVTAD